MLVRCEHCSEVYPSDRGRCPKCKTPYTPPPPPPAPPPPSRKANTIASFAAVFGVMFAIICFVIGMLFITERFAEKVGVILCFVAMIFIVIAAMGMIGLKKSHDVNVERNKPTVSPEEYEQRIRDFINQ